MVLIANNLVYFCIACTLLAQCSLATKTASLRGWSAMEQSYIPELPWFSILYSWFPGGVSIFLQKEVEWIEPNKQSNILSKTSEPQIPLVAVPNALAEEPNTPIVDDTLSPSPSPPTTDNSSEEKKKQERDGDNDDDGRRRRTEAIEGDDDWFKSDDEWTNADENFFYADFYADFFYYDEEYTIVTE